MSSTLGHIDKYELRAVLARTPTSIVYDGWDPDIARRIAVKMVPLSTVEDNEIREALIRFKRGVQAAGRLAHPNVVSIYKYGETEDYAYIVMEFVDGPTLKQLLDGGRRFDLPAVCRIMDGVLQGLQYSHDHGVVHRDMKPANIMFTKSQCVKITDFGIARLEDSRATMTQAGMVIGTPAYMSPEQFLGEEVDWRSDIYSTGVVLYHMVTGARPYEGNLATIMNKVLHAPVPRPSSLSPEISPVLDQVVTRAMAKKRDDRFQSAAEFNAALQDAQEHFGQTFRRHHVPRSEPRTPFQQRQRRNASSRRPVLTGAAVAVLAAAGFGVGAYFSTPQITPHPPPRLIVSDSAVGGVKPRAEPEPPQPAAPATPSPAPPAASPKADQAPAPIDLPDNSDALRPPPTLTPSDASNSGFAQNDLPAAASDPPPLQAPQLAQRSSPEPPPRAELGKVNSRVAPPPPERKNPASRAPEKRIDRGADVRNADTIQEALNRLKNAPRERTDAPPVDDTPGPAVAYPVPSASPEIGLFCQSLTPEKAQEIGLDPPRGLLVLGVTAGSPAARAGIRAKDVILKVNGTETQSIASLKAGPGHPTRIEVFRDGRTIPLSLPAS
jgi:serine/threonine-protein kinase